MVYNSFSSGRGQTPRDRAGYGDYNKAKDYLKNAFSKTGNGPNDVLRRANDYVGRDTYGNTGGGYDTGYDVNALRAQWDSWLNEMNAYYKTLYNQAMKNNRTQFEKTRDPINLNFKRNEKAIRSMLGPDSGRGVGMLSGNNNDWANRIADARNWLGNQNSQTLADYQKNIADVKKVYAEKMASLM